MPASSKNAEPLPLLGAVHANDHARLFEVVCVALRPLLVNFTDPVPAPGEDKVPLSTSRLNPPFVPLTPLTEILIVYC